MVRLIVNRAGFSILTLLMVGLVLFFLTRTIAGDPALVVLGSDATQQQIEEFRRDNNLDQPVVTQYAQWLIRIVRYGDFGKSFVTGRQMSDEVARGLPITFRIVAIAFCFALLLALPLGIISAIFHDRWIDHLTRVFAVIGVSVPGFWLGLILIRFLAVELRWVPPGGYIPPAAGLWPHLQSLLLPCFCLGIYYVGILSRMTRSSLIEVMASDYIRTARSLGLSRARILIYALKNALVPVVNIAAMSFGYMFGWALVIEQVFNIPGMSRALLTAISQRDYFMIQAVVFVFTAIFILANLIADLLNRYLTPKLRTAR
jgi:peptide/nickel transport system permease protein